MDKKLKTIFLVLGIFPGKADYVILLGVECTIKHKIESKSLEPFLRKSKFKIFFSCELSLIVGVGGKLKKCSRYLQEDPRYRIWMSSVDWFRPRARKSGTLCHWSGRNVSHYCRPLRLVYVFWAQRSTARCADSIRCTPAVPIGSNLLWE